MTDIYSVVVKCDPESCLEYSRKRCGIHDRPNVLEEVSKNHAERLATKFHDETMEVMIAKKKHLGQVNYRVPNECLCEVKKLNGTGR